MTITEKKRSIVKDIRRDKYMIIMIVPAFVLLAVFCYFPMFGLVMAFENFIPGLGFLGSPWFGLYWIGGFAATGKGLVNGMPSLVPGALCLVVGCRGCISPTDATGLTFRVIDHW